MAELFKAVNTNYRDIDMLAENILAQMMFADAYTEAIFDIFALYYAGRSRGMVVKAFLRFCAYQYIIKDLKIPADIMECLYKEVAKKNITDEISEMALLFSIYRTGNRSALLFCRLRWTVLGRTEGMDPEYSSSFYRQQ